MRPGLLAAVLLAATGCRDWRSHVDPTRAAGEPEQVPLADAGAVEYEAKGHRIRLEPRATYRITGYAVETSRTLLDEWDFAMPLDVALAWGPAADPEVLRHLTFHLSGRYVSWWYDAETPRAAVPALASHISNNHLIPADDGVAGVLRTIRVGDLVTLRGRLVDVEIRDAAGRAAFRSRTSLVRDDVGSGACEQIWVEAAQVERPE